MNVASCGRLQEEARRPAKKLNPDAVRVRSHRWGCRENYRKAEGKP